MEIDESKFGKSTIWFEKWLLFLLLIFVLVKYHRGKMLKDNGCLVVWKGKVGNVY